MSKISSQLAHNFGRVWRNYIKNGETSILLDALKGIQGFGSLRPTGVSKEQMALIIKPEMQNTFDNLKAGGLEASFVLRCIKPATEEVNDVELQKIVESFLHSCKSLRLGHIKLTEPFKCEIEKQISVLMNTENDAVTISYSAKYLLQILDSFPFLKLMKLNSAMVSKFFTKLLQNEELLSAVRYHEIYWLYLEPQHAYNLLEHITDAREWKYGMALLLGCHEIEERQRQHAEKPEVVDKEKYLWGVQEISEIKETVLYRFMRKCIEVNSKDSMDALLTVTTSPMFANKLVAEAATYRKTLLTYKEAAIKGKWRKTLITTRGKEASSILFRALYEECLFAEAKFVQSNRGLGFRVAPITSEQLSAQKELNASRYLTFPSSSVKTSWVDNLDTLQRMSDTLHLPLSLELGGHDPYAELKRTQESVRRERELGVLERLQLRAQQGRPTSFDPRSPHALSPAQQAQEPSAAKNPREYTLSEVVQLIKGEKFSASPSSTDSGGKVVRQVVGVDMEWGHADSRRHTQSVSIMQLATREEVFIVDMRSEGFLRQESMRLRMRSFLRGLFQDSSILKVGWGLLASDLHQLSEHMKGFFQPATMGINALLDIEHVARHPTSRFRELRHPVQKEFLTSNNNDDNFLSVSLSNACLRYLGKPASKFEQLSNWEKRPLEESQLRYASLDAHCLLGILDAMLLEQGVDSALHVAREQYQLDS